MVFHLNGSQLGTVTSIQTGKENQYYWEIDTII